MGLLYRHADPALHDTGRHPENATRLLALEAAMAERSYLGLEPRWAPEASPEALERAHSRRHVKLIEELCSRGGGWIDADTVVSPGSWEAARLAAGGAIAGAKAVLAGEAPWAFAALRPPGHHAERDAAMGFCLFNNVAVAARHATHELEVERVLICDWDVHHPNGTEEIFAASDEVLLASIHQSPLYPGTGPARYEGDGAGEGYTVNMPVEPGAGSDRFVALVEHVVAPLARAFEPGLIVVSAGFDAHRRDPLASCTVDERGFAEMAALIRDVARELDVGVLVCLEGGYDVESLISSSFAMIEAFEGDLRAEPRPAELAEPHRGRVAERWSL